jgi:hypothetical protein
MLHNHSSSDETCVQYHSVRQMLPWFISAEVCSLAHANFYAELSGVPDHQTLDYWSFTAYYIYRKKFLKSNYFLDVMNDNGILQEVMLLQLKLLHPHWEKYNFIKIPSLKIFSAFNFSSTAYTDGFVRSTFCQSFSSSSLFTFSFTLIYLK